MPERVWTCNAAGCVVGGVQTAGGPLRKWCSEACRKGTLYAGVCTGCGGPTDGSNGADMAPELCAACTKARAKWTREQILDAVVRAGRPISVKEIVGHTAAINRSESQGVLTRLKILEGMGLVERAGLLRDGSRPSVLWVATPTATSTQQED